MIRFFTQKKGSCRGFACAWKTSFWCTSEISWRLKFLSKKSTGRSCDWTVSVFFFLKMCRPQFGTAKQLGPQKSLVLSQRWGLHHYFIWNRIGFTSADTRIYSILRKVFWNSAKMRLKSSLCNSEIINRRNSDLTRDNLCYQHRNRRWSMLVTRFSPYQIDL